MNKLIYMCFLGSLLALLAGVPLSFLTLYYDFNLPETDIHALSLNVEFLGSFIGFVGFCVVASTLRKTQLLITSVLMSFLVALQYASEVLEITSFSIGTSNAYIIFLLVSSGIIYILFGVDLMSTKYELGTVSTYTGLTAAFYGGLILTIVLSPIAYLFLFPLEILKAITLYRASYILDKRVYA